jgi:GTP-binding protein
MFVDVARVKFKAGDGGNGAVSFRHEKFVDRGGPDGGDGGVGGDIVLKASRNQDSLAAFRYQKQLRAENGSTGGKTRKHGKSGKNLEVAVPVGTVVTSDQGEVLADLTEDGQEMVIASGGKGGFGNAHFVSSTRQAPRVAEKGEKGDEFEGTLEIKLIADVGIIGLPNAGKSTFLSVVSNAKPEIANYPFTTLHPYLGVVDIGKKTLLLADIPGLIEGASKGKGLGDEFLRHVERTSVLLHLIDVYSEDLPRDYKTIITELKEYKVDLSRRPQVIALTKTEGLSPAEVNQSLKQVKAVVPKGTKVMVISSVSGLGVKEVLRELDGAVSRARRTTKKGRLARNIPVIGLRQDEDDWHIIKADDVFVVTGRKIERFAGRTKFDDYHSLQRLRDIMRKMGIMHELGRRGAQPGQAIVIGQPETGRVEY